MNVKRFVAANMRRALELVKQEMGDDAIILSSKRVKEGVEILTSNDIPYQYAHSASQLADTQSNYGGITRQLSPDMRSSLFSRNKKDSSALVDGVAIHSDDARNWQNTRQQQHEQSRGLASGKTRQQLAREIEQARQKMEAADRIPLSQQDNWLNPNINRKTNTDEIADPVNHLNPAAPPPANASFVSGKTIPQHHQRIEPQVPNHVDQELLAPMEAQSTAPRNQNADWVQPSAPAKSIPNIHSPLAALSGNYSWHGPQDLSNYLIVPEDEVADHDQVEESEAHELQLQALKDEISDMRDMLHVQLERLRQNDNQGNPANNAVSLAAAIKATISRRLRQMGFAGDYIAELIADTKVRAGLAETWADVLAAVAHQIPVCQRDIVGKGGVFAVVGPSGAGKTTTIAKLATQFVLNNPRHGLSLIVLEEHDAKQSSLVRLGKILDVPVISVSDRKGLQRAVAERADDYLVLIDTPSCNFQKRNNWVSQAFSRLPQIEKILALPANAQLKSLAATVANYQNLNLKAGVLTKLDDCASLGEAINVVVQARLPLAYCSSGQSIPDDIQPARGYKLVTQAVALLKQEQSASKKSVLKDNNFQSCRQSLSA